MIDRERGKIIVFGSATPLRGLSRLAAYTAAPRAQARYVRSAGVELTSKNIQVNPKFQAKLKRDVPVGRLARPEEDSALALFLASDDSDFFVGQSIPFASGWVS